MDESGEHRPTVNETGEYCIFDGDDWPCPAWLAEDGGQGR